jgi:DHA2 family multidrug resistance protein
VLTQSVSAFSEATRTRIDQLTHYFMAHGVPDQAAATAKAIVAVGGRVRQQANIMAFSDTFFLLGAALVVALVATVLLKKPDHLEAGGGH